MVSIIDVVTYYLLKGINYFRYSRNIIKNLSFLSLQHIKLISGADQGFCTTSAKSMQTHFICKDSCQLLVGRDGR